MRREPVVLESFAKEGEPPLRTAVVGPTSSELDSLAPDAPVMVFLHSFDSRWEGQLYSVILEHTFVPAKLAC